jgi:hypothetical protein
MIAFIEATNKRRVILSDPVLPIHVYYSLQMIYFPAPYSMKAIWYYFHPCADNVALATLAPVLGSNKRVNRLMHQLPPNCTLRVRVRDNGLKFAHRHNYNLIGAHRVSVCQGSSN